MSVIDHYLSRLDPPQRAALERIRQIVREQVPEATEVISYRMPVFEYNGNYLIGFNAFKDHLSLFPTSEPIETLRDQLTDFKLSRGTIQFTTQEPIPEPLIKELIAIRMKSITREPT